MAPSSRRAGLAAGGWLAAAGALHTLAFVHTRWGWWWPLLAIGALAWMVGRSGPRRAAWLGWCFGTGWLLAATWWLFISLHRYGGLPAPLAVAAVLLLCAALSLYLALAMAAVARRRSGRPLADAAWFALAWGAAELARALLFTGFPWAATGYSQVDGPLAALAPWVGVYGIGMVVALAAALPVIAWAGRTPRQRLAAAGLAAALLAAPALLGRVEFSRPAGTLSVALLQTNVAQDEKFAAQHLPATLAWVAQALTQAPAQLVVAPETAVPLLPAQLEDLVPGYWDGLRRHFGRADGPAALVGVPLGSERDGYTNSALGLSAAPGPAYRYDKTHLVPFGEFIPTGFRWFTRMMNIPLGDFNRGPLQAPSFQVHGQRLAPNICYEDLFGEELAQRFTDAASAPTVLVNIGNIGWFGNTIAVPQHLQISRLRSLELQRPMVRATNTGATAAIDHRGRVLAELPPFQQGVLQATVQGRDGLTPYVRWVSATGLWMWWGAAVLALAWPRRRRPQS